MLNDNNMQLNTLILPMTENVFNTYTSIVHNGLMNKKVVCFISWKKTPTAHIVKLKVSPTYILYINIYI